MKAPPLNVSLLGLALLGTLWLNTKKHEDRASKLVQSAERNGYELGVFIMHQAWLKNHPATNGDQAIELELWAQTNAARPILIIDTQDKFEAWMATNDTYWLGARDTNVALAIKGVTINGRHERMMEERKP